MNHGFKLADAMWCVVVVGLLSTILLPALSPLGDRPDLRERCIENTKAIGRALAAYASDHDGRLMGRPDNDWPFGDGTTSLETWADWSTPYLDSSDVLRCPAYTGTFPVPDFYGINRSFRQTYSISFAIISTGGTALGGNLEAVPNPASAALVAESVSGFTWFSGSETWNVWTAADMIMHRAGVHDAVKLVPDCSTAANRAFCRNISPTGGVQRALPAVRARVTLLSADFHARSGNMTNLLSREKEPGTDRVIQPFWSGLSGDPLASP